MYVSVTKVGQGDPKLPLV